MYIAVLSSHRFKEAVGLINGIEGKKLPLLVSRIIQKLGTDVSTCSGIYCQVLLAVGCLSMVNVPAGPSQSIQRGGRSSAQTGDVHSKEREKW
jgi:hypothetical protein